MNVYICVVNGYPLAVTSSADAALVRMHDFISWQDDKNWSITESVFGWHWFQGENEARNYVLVLEMDDMSRFDSYIAAAKSWSKLRSAAGSGNE